MEYNSPTTCRPLVSPTTYLTTTIDAADAGRTSNRSQTVGASGLDNVGPVFGQRSDFHTFTAKIGPKPTSASWDGRGNHSRLV